MAGAWGGPEEREGSRGRMDRGTGEIGGTEPAPVGAGVGAAGPICRATGNGQPRGCSMAAGVWPQQCAYSRVLSTLWARPEPPLCCPGSQHSQSPPQPWFLVSTVSPAPGTTSAPRSGSAAASEVRLLSGHRQKPPGGGKCWWALAAEIPRRGVQQAVSMRLLPKGIRLLPLCISFPAKPHSPSSPSSRGLWTWPLPRVPATPGMVQQGGAGPAVTTSMARRTRHT